MLGDLLTLLFTPVALISGCLQAAAVQARMTSNACTVPRNGSGFGLIICGKNPDANCAAHQRRPGARMNVDHIRPLHRDWHLRLAPWNLQTLCASYNWGRGGQMVRVKKR